MATVGVHRGIFEEFSYDVIERRYPGARVYRAGCVLVSNSKVLFVVERKLTDETGKTLGERLGFPKGARDPRDATAFDTAARELFEETGISVEGKCAATSVIIIPRNVPLREVSFYFLISAGVEPDVRIDNEEIVGYEWLPIDNMRRGSNTMPTRAVIRVLEGIDNWVDIDWVPLGCLSQTS